MLYSHSSIFLHFSFRAQVRISFCIIIVVIILYSQKNAIKIRLLFKLNTKKNKLFAYDSFCRRFFCLKSILEKISRKLPRSKVYDVFLIVIRKTITFGYNVNLKIRFYSNSFEND